MTHKNFSINSIFLNCTNIKSASSIQQVDMKSKGGMVAIIWLSFTGSLTNSYAGFVISAILIKIRLCHIMFVAKSINSLQTQYRTYCSIEGNINKESSEQNIWLERDSVCFKSEALLSWPGSFQMPYIQEYVGSTNWSWWL